MSRDWSFESTVYFIESTGLVVGIEIDREELPVSLEIGIKILLLRSQFSINPKSGRITPKFLFDSPDF
jgi:hypothetical protein